MDELKPCPFCKTEAQRFAKTTFPPGMVSPMCHCFDVPFEDAGYSPEVWNTRPIEDELAAEITKLEHIIDDMEEDIARLRLEVETLHKADEVMTEQNNNEIQAQRDIIRALRSSWEKERNAANDLLANIGKWAYRTAGQTMPMQISDAIAEFELQRVHYVARS